MRGEEFAGTARTGVTGTGGPEDRSRRLPMSSRRAARWTVTSQRARTHPQARAYRRRNIAEWRTAIAAEFSAAVGCPQPVAARRTFRINALHSPSRQILHVFPPIALWPRWNDAPIFPFAEDVPGSPYAPAVNSEPLQSPGPETHGKSCRNSALLHLWCQEKRYNI